MYENSYTRQIKYKIILGRHNTWKMYSNFAITVRAYIEVLIIWNVF